jgi:hypothetical protein
MPAQLRFLGGGELWVDETAAKAADLLWGGSGSAYAQLHVDGNPFFVNPTAVASINESVDEP